MKIAQLTTSGFRVPDGTYSFRASGGPSDVVLVTGAPGSGKTMFLRLLAGAKEAFAPYGAPPDLRSLLAPKKSAGRLTLTLVLNDAEKVRAKTTSSEQTVIVDVEPAGEMCSASPGLRAAFSRAELVSCWELFPIHRHLATKSWSVPHPPLSEAIESSRRLVPDGDKYIVLRRVLYELALEQATGISRTLGERGVALGSDGAEGLARYREAVATMLPDLRLLSVDLAANTAAPVFLRRNGESLTIAELCANEEQGVLFAFAFSWLHLQSGVILVDSPELHIASSEHTAFVERLYVLGGGAQLFLATEAPTLAQLPGALVIELDRMPGARR